MHICHITTVHPRSDTRIFLKYCRTFAAKYGESSLIVADGNGSINKDLVSIYDIGKFKNPIFRILFGSPKVIIKAFSLNADIYHLHDPELVFAGIFLRLLGKKVIMDLHEDAPAQMKDKHYMNSMLRHFLSFVIRLTENIFFGFFSGLVAATPHLKNAYKNKNKRILGIYNYLLISELYIDKNNLRNNNPIKICFVGGIEEKRGILKLVNSLPNINKDVILILGGNFPDIEFKNRLMQSPGWAFVDYRGYLSRDDMSKVFQDSIIGIVPFLPAENHINSLPNKIFEYMGAGLSVLGSNFEYWKKLIEDNGVGYCVDTTDSNLIANKINFMLKDRNNLIEMGRVGAKLIKEKYNWEIQMNSLVNFYNCIISNENINN